MVDHLKVAVITGGSRGLGKNAALALAKKGIDVILTYHSKRADAESVVAEIERTGRKAVALQLDAGVARSFDRFAMLVSAALKEKWSRGSFDFLVNNAGVGHYSSVAQTEEAALDQMFNVHFKGVYLLTQMLLPLIAAAVVSLTSRPDWPGLRHPGTPPMRR